jgi:hypothetical protein
MELPTFTRKGTAALATSIGLLSPLTAVIATNASKILTITAVMLTIALAEEI